MPSCIWVNIGSGNGLIFTSYRPAAPTASPSSRPSWEIIKPIKSLFWSGLCLSICVIVHAYIHVALCEENPLFSSGFPSQRTSKINLWIFLMLPWRSCWTTIELPVIWDIMLITVMRLCCLRVDLVWVPLAYKWHIIVPQKYSMRKYSKIKENVYLRNTSLAYRR